MKKILSLVAAAVLIAGVSSTVYAKNNYEVKRIYGNTRYETSTSISNAFSDGKITNVIIASGNNFPDALAGSVLSKKLNAPILLVDKDLNRSADSINYIKSHLDSDGTVYVLGGNASVSEEYINNIKSLGFKNVERLGGTDRFDTNSIISRSMNVQKGTPIVLVNGYGFADALSVSSVAALKGYPILMSGPSGLSEKIQSQIKDIQPSKVYIIGGQSVLNNTVVEQIKSIVPTLTNDNIARIYGQNRYETSLNICKYFNLSTDTAIVANGESFPDALSGSALAAKLNAPIILTDGKNITNQKGYIDSNNFSKLILLGGNGSVSVHAENDFKGIVEKYNFEVNSSLYIPDVTTKDTKVRSYKQADVNGDGVNEHVVLTGTGTSNLEQPKLLVFDEKQNLIQSANLGGENGWSNDYGYRMRIEDVNKDGSQDVIISEPHGGKHNGSTLEVLSFKDNKLNFLLNAASGPIGNRNIIDDMKVEYNPYEGNVKVHVNSQNKDFSIQVKEDEYNSSAIERVKNHKNEYNMPNADKWGTFIRACYGGMVKLNDGSYGLLFSYDIHNEEFASGFNLGYVNYTYKWNVEKSQWEIINSEVLDRWPSELDLTNGFN